MGDFDINLLHSDVDKQTSNSMDNIYSNSFFPTINLPTLSFTVTFAKNKSCKYCYYHI